MSKYSVWFVPAIMGADWTLVAETDSQAEAFEKYLELKRQQYDCRIVRHEVIEEHTT